MQFSKHPLIDIIAQNQVMNDGSLLRGSGMDKKKFKAEFQKLIDEGHIVIGSHDRIYPRFLTLVVRDIDTKMFVREIDLEYISTEELYRLTGYDELDENFIEGQILKPENARHIEAKIGLEMDFNTNEYTLLVGFANLAYQEPALKRNLTIIHLDDHEVFARGMEIGVRNKYFPDSEWNHFSHPDKARAFIEDKFARNESINIIITDILHLGSNGYEFAQAIRTLESEYNMFRTPIIVVSMRPEDNSLVEIGISEKLYDKYFPKYTEAEIIGNYMKDLLKPTWV